METRASALALIVFAVLVLTASQLIIKSRLTVHGVVPLGPGLWNYLLGLLADWRMWCAAVGLILASLGWYAAVSRLPLSIAFPFAALSYPAVLFGSLVFLGESVSLQMIAGNALVVAGILIISLAPAT